MDLGITGKKAIVCAASKGLGKGCAKALAREGVHVTICLDAWKLNNPPTYPRSYTQSTTTAPGCFAPHHHPHPPIQHTREV